MMLGSCLNHSVIHYKDGDDWLLGFCIQKVENSIKNECNVSSVPCGLKSCNTDGGWGIPLFSKKGDWDNYRV